MSCAYPPLCDRCDGDGQTGMHRDGTPMVCLRCAGSGFSGSFQSDEMQSRVDAASDWARDEAYLTELLDL